MKKNKLYLVLVALVVMAAAMLSGCGSDEDIIAKAAEEANEMCPMQIDAYTSLDSVEAVDGKTIQYNYTMTTYAAADVTDEMKTSIQETVPPTVIENIKNTDEMKALRDMEASFRYVYNSNDGVELVVIDITPEDYAA
ncbi:MAG: hypothetical protein LBR44_04575 [Clostridiales Family XIII bacterium]|jgi:hypothetical protein|nr:hypothetical protein [Clostridiales Family XIII bacterium]